NRQSETGLSTGPRENGIDLATVDWNEGLMLQVSLFAAWLGLSLLSARVGAQSDHLTSENFPAPPPGKLAGKPLSDQIRISGQRLTSRPVDLKQGGQFIELLCGLIPSMLAQQVDNSSFEEDPPWKVAFRPETDKPRRPWYPDGTVHLARYSFDTNQPF